jgi:hypothetical protein
MKRKLSWAEKLKTAKPHAVKPAPIDIAGMKAGEIMLVPSPRIVDDFIRTIPYGTAVDIPTLRRRLAAQYRAMVTCPITMGFQLRIVAEAACEAYAQGRAPAEITPVWRVLDEGAPTTRKLGAGAAFILRERAREGLSPGVASPRRIPG